MGGLDFDFFIRFGGIGYVYSGRNSGISEVCLWFINTL